MLGHDDITHDYELETLPNLLENLQEAIAAARRAQDRHPLVTTERDENGGDPRRSIVGVRWARSQSSQGQSGAI